MDLGGLESLHSPIHGFSIVSTGTDEVESGGLEALHSPTHGFSIVSSGTDEVDLGGLSLYTHLYTGLALYPRRQMKLSWED